MGQRGLHHGDHEIHLPRHQIDERGGVAFVRDMHDVHAGHGLEHLRRQVRRRAHTRRGVVHLARARLRQRDQLFHVLRGNRRMDHHHVLDAAHQRHGREILDHVVRQLGVDARRHRHRAKAHQQQVAVRRRLGDRLGADVAAGAGTIFDDDVLPQQLRHLLRDHAGVVIVGAAGRKSRHEADRLGWIGLSKRIAASNDAERSEHARNRWKSHGVFL